MDDHTMKSSGGGCTGIWWWATLLVAVLAVPSFGVAVASAVPIEGIGTVLVFILACWLCTYLGMKLMDNPKMNETINKKD